MNYNNFVCFVPSCCLAKTLGTINLKESTTTNVRIIVLPSDSCWGHFTKSTYKKLNYP